MRDILYIILTTVLANNVMFVRFEGLCSFMSCPGRKSSVRFLTFATGFVLVFASVFSWIADRYILTPLNAEYLKTVVIVFIIACFVQVVDNVTAAQYPRFREEMGICLVLIATNSAVLTICLESAQQDSTLISIILSALGTALGFGISTFLFGGIREKIENSNVPECFKGTPATLIAASIISLAFYGFEGVVTGIFSMGL
ncbi:MAG: electron transport complex subunit RsxA [Clostridia bacterium]|nr:electron transport complex subunit RsxA [Clostridia bacterium]